MVLFCPPAWCCVPHLPESLTLIRTYPKMHAKRLKIKVLPLDVVGVSRYLRPSFILIALRNA